MKSNFYLVLISRVKNKYRVSRDKYYIISF